MSQGYKHDEYYEYYGYYHRLITHLWASLAFPMRTCINMSIHLHLQVIHPIEIIVDIAQSNFKTALAPMCTNRVLHAAGVTALYTRLPMRGAVSSPQPRGTQSGRAGCARRLACEAGAHRCATVSQGSLVAS